MSELETLSEYLAESIARQMCAANHTLLFTALDPDQLLQCAMEAFAKTVPGFKDAPQEALQLFADSLGIALCDRMLLENDLAILARRGVQPC